MEASDAEADREPHAARTHHQGGGSHSRGRRDLRRGEPVHPRDAFRLRHGFIDAATLRERLRATDRTREAIAGAEAALSRILGA